MNQQEARKILDAAKSRLVVLNEGSLSRSMASAQWTDRAGNHRSVTGPSVTYPGVDEVVGLRVRTNQRSVMAICRAVRRVDHALDLLIDTCRQNPAALPPDLGAYVEKLIGEIPQLDSIVLEVIEPKGAKAAPEKTKTSENQ